MSPNAKSVSELAAQIGGKVDILINNAEFHRAYGIASRRGTEIARAEMDVNYFGLLRLAQDFGRRPARPRGRRAGECDRMGQHTFDFRAQQFSRAWDVLGIEGGGAIHSRSACAPRCAPPVFGS